MLSEHHICILVPDFEVVFPYTVDQSARQRINKTIRTKQQYFVHFRAFGQDFHLNLSINTDAAANNQVIEHHSKGGVTRFLGKEQRHVTGHIVKNAESLVSLDHNAGMVGPYYLTCCNKRVFS